MAKFQVGDMVRTIKGTVLEGWGEIVEVILPSNDLQLLWGTDETHYLFKDAQSGEYISAIERMLERV